MCRQIQTFALLRSSTKHKMYLKFLQIRRDNNETEKESVFALSPQVLVAGT